MWTGAGRRTMLLAVVALFAAGACSGDDTDDTSVAASTTSTSTSTSTTSTTSTTVAPTTVPPTTVPPPTVPPTAPPPPPTTVAPPRATAPPSTARPVAPFAGDPDTFRQPMNGRVYVTLAWDCGGCVAELGSKHHPAIDYKSRDDDTIVAAGHGVVVWLNDGCGSPSQGCGSSMGNAVFLRHTLADGTVIHTFYAHLAELDPAVAVGACLAQGQRVGLMGNSGIGSAAHLHFAFQTEPEILQYTVASSYESGSRNPDDYYGTVKVQRCA